MYPKVILVVALSLDGRIARRPQQIPHEWTSLEDRDWLRKITRRIGVLIMGRKTFETIGRPLKRRRLIVLTHSPEDYADKNLAGVVEFSNLPPEELLKKLKEEGVKEVGLMGGTKVYSDFFKKGLVDEIWVTIEPLIFGQGLPFLEVKLPPIQLNLKKIEKLNPNTILLHYKVVPETPNAPTLDPGSK